LRPAPGSIIIPAATGVPSEAAMTPKPATGPQIWRGPEMALRRDWIVALGPDALAELEAAAEAVRRRGLVLDNATREDFHLPRVGALLADIGRELATGRGFALLRGLRLERYSEDEIGTLFWGMGTHLGVCVSQSLAGDRLGHVRDLGRADRYYTIGGPLEFHMDPVDVVGLLCLRAAKSGGESRIVSAIAVRDALAAERPDLWPALARGWHYSRRAQDPDGAEHYTPHRVPVFAEGAMGPECYFLPQPVRKAVADGAEFTDRDREAMDAVAAVANRPELYLDMTFREGDIQFLNNRTILHARTDYEDDPDPALHRHLLRLWLMMPDWPERPMTMRQYSESDRAGGGIPCRTAAG
jgi:Taurine catabolism dioxygenase TauD, TfdA family